LKLGEKLPRDTSPLRVRLRSMKIADDKFPKRVRASTITSFWWCGWKSYATAILGLKMPEKEWMSLGTKLHDELFDTLGKRFPWETRFIEDIDKYREDDVGFRREFEDTNIYVDLTGHPDDFQVTPGGLVSIIEYKTTRMPLYLARRFILPVAKFQARLYPYILSPTIVPMGYSIGEYHAPMIYSSKDLSLMCHKIVRYSPSEVEKSLREIFYFYDNPEKIKAPMKWKCKYCSKVYKDVCPLFSV